MSQPTKCPETPAEWAEWGASFRDDSFAACTILIEEITRLQEALHARLEAAGIEPGGNIVLATAPLHRQVDALRSVNAQQAETINDLREEIRALKGAQPDGTHPGKIFLFGERGV